jgi:hypothetical protein
VLQDGTAVTTGSSRAPGKRNEDQEPTHCPTPRPPTVQRGTAEDRGGRRQGNPRVQEGSPETVPSGLSTHRRPTPTRPEGNEGAGPSRSREPAPTPRPRDGRGEERREAEGTRGDPRTHHHRPPTPPRTRETGTSGDTSRFFPRVDFGLF